MFEDGTETMMAGQPSPDARDAGGGVRILSLDIARGAAVIGIVFMNVFFFAMPSAAYFNPRAWGGMEVSDLIAWTLGFLFVEDKMRMIFAALFGAGMMLMLERGRARGRPVWSAHYRRMFWLFVIGLLHAILLANNDVLRLYAICGLFFPLFARLDLRGLMILAAMLLLLHIAATGYIALQWLELYHRVMDEGLDPNLLLPAERAFGADPEALRAQIERHAGLYGDIIARRMSNPLALLIALVAVLPITLAQMALGIALLKSGFLTGAWSRTAYRRTAWIAAGLSLPPLAALAGWAWSSDFAAVVVAGNAMVWSTPFDIMLALSWLAILMLWMRDREASWLARRLAAAGRMTLSNYLLTSLLLASFYFSFGFGMFGYTGRLETYVPALVVTAGILLWSQPWIARYGQGPAERAWRWLVGIGATKQMEMR